MAVSPLPAIPPAVSKSKAFGKEMHAGSLAVRQNTVNSSEAKNKNEENVEPIRPVTDYEQPKYIKGTPILYFGAPSKHYLPDVTDIDSTRQEARRGNLRHSPSRPPRELSHYACGHQEDQDHPHLS